MKRFLLATLLTALTLASPFHWNSKGITSGYNEASAIVAVQDR